MANLRYATTPRNSMMDQIRTALAGGSIKIYSGTQPANANTALSGNTLLATLTLASPAGPASPGGTFTFGTITGATAAASAPASFARVFQSDGTAVVCAMDVGASGATFILGTV